MSIVEKRGERTGDRYIGGCSTLCTARKNRLSDSNGLWAFGRVRVRVSLFIIALTRYFDLFGRPTRRASSLTLVGFQNLVLGCEGRGRFVCYCGVWKRVLRGITALHDAASKEHRKPFCSNRDI